MAKIYKATIYFIDYNDEYENEEHFAEDLTETSWRLPVITHFAEVKESKHFKWDDDLKINKVETTTEDHEEYFKNR